MLSSCLCRVRMVVLRSFVFVFVLPSSWPLRVSPCVKSSGIGTRSLLFIMSYRSIWPSRYLCRRSWGYLRMLS
ncbi:hypothetical protein VTN49DRAFT_1653 [Thermomyces lanuginosus]|uniref:uncharacterized protein n=1 Tax=Thermomyces lanuginosus TaxID=5541 RepID=UPI0037428E69